MNAPRNDLGPIQRTLAIGALVVLLVGVVVYGRYVSRDGWTKVANNPSANDFASYYYAAKVAADGNSPYETSKLREKAAKDGRRAPYPFFYPPPYLIAMAWVLPLDLHDSHKIFYWAGSLFLISVLMALWRWISNPAMVAMSGVVLISFTPIHNTLRMGQANLLVLALMVWGVALVEGEGANRRRWWGGALVGLACMMKMSPALLVLWWMVRRDWRPVLGAMGAAVVTSLAVLPLVGFGHQWTFYTEVLPGFTSGSYHDLSVSINIPMNHSILNFWMQIESGFEGMTYGSDATPLASNLARATALGFLLGLFYLLRNVSPDAVSRSNAAGAFVVLMVLIPAYAYEHHLVFLLFPLLTVSAALWQGRLHWHWSFFFVPIYLVLAWELGDFKDLARHLGDCQQLPPKEVCYSPPAVVFRELKFLAALGLGVLCVLAAVSTRRATPAPVEKNPAQRPLVKHVRPLWDRES